MHYNKYKHWKNNLCWHTVVGATFSGEMKTACSHEMLCRCTVLEYYMVKYSIYVLPCWPNVYVAT